VIRVGIDEAGYGPLLGPLVIGAAAFRVAEGPRPTLRERLKGIVCRAGSAPRQAKGEERRLPVEVDDSKQVYPRLGVEGLARGVATCVAASGRAPATTLSDWLERFADRPAPAFAADPWFEGPERERLPDWVPPEGLRERVIERGVEPLGVVVSPVIPPELNDSIDATGNKGRVLFLATMALLLRVLRTWPGEDVDVTLDREGGRLDYEGYLAEFFPMQAIGREPAPRGDAVYVLEEGGRRVRLRFATRADGEDLPTALASMAAKLTRELFMARLNAWFVARQEGLKPTAGYTEDGHRFLADVAPVLTRERVDLRRLIRNR
jgi:hypothetical protein